MITLEEQLGGSRNVIGGPFGSNLTRKDYTDKGVPVIRGSNMVAAGRWLGGYFAFVSEEKVESDLKSNLAYPGDIIVTQRGTLGQVAIVPYRHSFKRYVISQSQMAVRVPKNKADRDFVYYFLQSPEFAAYVERSTIQTGVPHINLGILRRAPATWPEKDQQSRIASILVALDNKIQLNWRMNETLEAMARAIFRDWFVDFGPTRAKAEGRAPYLVPEVWNLFPGELDDEDKPAGWKMRGLGELVSLTKGRSYKSAELKESDVALVTLKSIGRGGGYRREGLKAYTGKYKPEQIIEPGELVVALTDVTQAADVIGKPALVLDDERYKTLVASLDIGIVRLFGDQVGRSFVWQLLQTEEFQSHAYSHCTGTTVLHLGRDALPTFNACIPSRLLVAQFENTVASMSARVAANARESRSLTDTRDLLLPKLMSGEICLREAEEAVEEAA